MKDRKKAFDEMKARWLMKGLDDISAECRRRGPGSTFEMGCPFCGASYALVMTCDEYTAAGECISCDYPVHVKWDHRKENENNVSQIRISGHSGYVLSNDYEYSDMLIITDHSIEYQCKPYEPSFVNPIQNWSYSTISREFAELFRLAADAVHEVFRRDPKCPCTDLPVTDFTVIYRDGSTVRHHYSVRPDEFSECFVIIKKMVPSCEPVPWVLMTSEDYSAR